MNISGQVNSTRMCLGGKCHYHHFLNYETVFQFDEKLRKSMNYTGNDRKNEVVSDDNCPFL